MTDKNIFWTDIPKSAKVKDLGASYLAILADGTRALVYWTGNDAGKAQAWLRMRATKA